MQSRSASQAETTLKPASKVTPDETGITADSHDKEAAE
jgi:hypothetical protein